MSPKETSPAKAGLALAALAIALMLGIFAMREGLQPRIDSNERMQRLATLAEVAGDIDIDESLLASEETFERRVVSGVRILRLWRAKESDGGITTVIEAEAPNGYVGPIRLLVGIDAANHIIAARVNDHAETPGLGAQIDRARSDWIDQFAGRSLAASEMNSWRLTADGGDFDKISGATITSRTMVQTLAIIGEWHSNNKL